MIRVTPKRGSDCWILENASHCYSNWLLGPQMTSRLDLRVRVCGVMFDYKRVHMGDCESQSEEGERQRKFLIRLERNTGLAVQLHTLAHEMVHVAQHVRDRMIVKHHPTEDDTAITIFDGKEYIIKGDIDEKDYPWEVEAVAIGEPLFDHFFDYLTACSEQDACLAPSKFPWKGPKV